MEESTTYQWIIRQGEARGEVRALHETLLRQGKRKFKAPAPDLARAAIESITSPERLAALTERIIDVASWDELLVE
jgi:hypothetical protein